MAPRSARLLEIEGLGKRFGGVVAAEAVALSLERGDLLALVGPNGCGKTTLFNLVSGFLRPDAGAIRYEGRDLSGLSPERIARLGVVRKFQVPSVFEELSLDDNLQVAQFAALAAAGVGSLFRRPPEDRPDPAALLEQVGLGGRGGERAGTLSHGEKQWLEIAMALACGPKLLLLDEPTAGMTRGETLATAQLLAEIRRTGGAAIMVIEHDLKFVEALGCRVAAMVSGRIVLEGSYDEVGRHPEVRAAYLGRSHA